MPALQLPYAAFAFLLPAAFVAGVVDAIGGGGGLITIPALLAAGLPPHVALGTNKGQAVFGSGTALARFSRAGLVDGARARFTFPAALLGAAVGVQLVLFIAAATLRPLVLVLLLCVAMLLAFAPQRVTRRARTATPRDGLTATAIALVIATYDGFFGPGTGTFLILAFVFFFGLTLTRATADAKVVNFGSNLASVVLFGSRGVIAWQVALPMAVAQFCGALLGSHLVVRRGERFVRLVVLCIVLALVVKLAFDLGG